MYKRTAHEAGMERERERDSWTCLDRYMASFTLEAFRRKIFKIVVKFRTSNTSQHTQHKPVVVQLLFARPE